MTTSEATNLARTVVADLSGADDATKWLAAVMLLMADEIDRLAGVVVEPDDGLKLVGDRAGRSSDL